MYQISKRVAANSKFSSVFLNVFSVSFSVAGLTAVHPVIPISEATRFSL
jgi:hypothetical protein